MTSKTGSIDVSGVPILNDNPPGTGSSQIKDWDDRLTTAVKAHGGIAISVLKGDTTLENMVRPVGPMPKEYNIEVLKLADDNILVYSKPEDKDEKKIYNAWIAFGKLLAKKDKANSLIYTAIGKRISEDLTLHVESQKDIEKGDGHAVYDYLIKRFGGGGASSLRIKLDAFSKITFEDGGSIHKLFADVLKAQHEVNSHGMPREMKELYEKIMAFIQDSKVIMERSEAIEVKKNDFNYDIKESLNEMTVSRLMKEEDGDASKATEQKVTGVLHL